MTPRRLIAVAACVVGLMTCAAPAAARAACSTANPASDFAGQTDFTSDQGIQQAFTAARAAEGCAVALVLPAGYDQMTPQQQMLWLFNNEREVRGLGDLSLDPTLMSQVSYNHSLEMSTYNYFEHPSPINAPSGTTAGIPAFARMAVNPALANAPLGEDIAAGYPTAAAATFGYMYQDSGSAWGHRTAILGNYNWVGIGVVLNGTGSWGNYWTDDFMSNTAYTPPASADTGAPVMGAISYANGSATVTGVADNPADVNDTGANPLTAAVTEVSFYTNNIQDLNGDGSAWNTVPATQTSPGTWSAQITVNPGDVLHAVAVDGSGNFTDMAAAPAAMTLAAGANTVALPAATNPGTATGQSVSATGRRAGSSDTRAVTPTAAALVHSVDRQIGRGAVRSVKVYGGGHWRVYRPGRGHDFALFTGEGVVLTLSRRGHWRPTTAGEPLAVPTLHLRRGWNFVAVPYPVIGMTCHATRLEIDHDGSHLLEISIGTRPNTGVVMKPHHGRWGDDLKVHIANQQGFWVHLTRAVTWTPSPTGYRFPADRLG